MPGKLCRFLCLLFVPAVRAATSTCTDELTATGCSNEQNDEICQDAFPITDAFPTVNSRCVDPEWRMALECRKQCRSCCQHPDFMCTDRENSALDCRGIAERGQCATTDDTFRAILAVECAGTCGLCRYGGCVDANYQLCTMLHKLCEQPQYLELMARKCKRTCNLCSVDVHYPSWVFNRETNAYYKVLNVAPRDSINNSAVKYEGMCIEEGAHLASIHSDAENEFVFGLANCDHVFIGLRGDTSDRFGWLDGSRMDFKNFYPGYPVGTQYCAYVNADNLFWYTASCHSKGCAVCKK